MSPHRLHRFLVAFAALVACGGERPDAPDLPLRVVDDAGLAVAFASPPERIVSLVPSVTSILVVLGAADRLVARTGFDHESDLAALPVLSETLTPSVERIVALRPDLVVVWPSPSTLATIARLEAVGIPLYRSDARSIDDIATTIGRFGVLLGRREQADSVAAAIEEQIGAIRRLVANRPRPTVLYLLWHDPPYTAGPDSYVDEILDTAGGRNAFADLGASWGPASLEEIVLRDPDWVVVPQGYDIDLPITVLETLPWSGLSAVRQGRVLTVDSHRFSRPGPDVAEAVVELARELHPDAFRSSVEVEG